MREALDDEWEQHYGGESDLVRESWRRHYSRRALAASLADTLGLDADEVAEALRRHVLGRGSPALCRGLLSPSPTRTRLERAVWDDVTDGAEWPWEESGDV